MLAGEGAGDEAQTAAEALLRSGCAGERHGSTAA